jgi:O-antigen/teichoic acid export membrane protein
MAGTSGRGLLRPVLLLSSASIIGNAVALISLPFITARVTPSQYGSLTVFLALITITTVVYTGGLELKLPSAPEPELGQVFSTGLAVSGVVGMMAGVSIYVLAIYGAIDTESPLVLSGATILGVAAWAQYALRFAYTMRKTEYGAAALSKVVYGAGSPMLQVAAVLAHPSGVALVASALTAKTISTKLLKRPSASVAFSRLSVVRSNGVFMRRTSLGALLNGLTIQGVPLVFAAMYGSREVGLYGLAYQVVSLPLVILGQAVSQSVNAEVGRDISQQRSHAAREKLRWLGVRLVVLGLAGVLAIGFVLPPLIRRYMSEDWHEVVAYVVAMLPLVFGQIVGSPIGKVLAILGRSSLLLAWDSSRFVLILFVLGVLSFLQLTPVSVLVIYSSMMLAWYVGLWVLTLRAVR